MNLITVFLTVACIAAGAGLRAAGYLYVDSAVVIDSAGIGGAGHAESKDE